MIKLHINRTYHRIIKIHIKDKHQNNLSQHNLGVGVRMMNLINSFTQTMIKIILDYQTMN